MAGYGIARPGESEQNLTTPIDSGFSVDSATQIADRIQQVKLRQQQVQQLQQENAAAIVNHLGDQMNQVAQLASQGHPAAKPLFTNLVKNLGSVSGQALSDDDQKLLLNQLKGDAPKFNAAMAALDNVNIDPVKKAQILAPLGQYVSGGPMGIAKLAETLQSGVAKELAAGQKVGTNLQNEKNKIAESYNKVNQTLGTSNKYFDEAQGVITALNKGELTTGQATSALKEMYIRGTTNQALRNFTIELQKTNTSAANKLNNYLDTIESGQSLQPSELTDMSKIMKIGKASTESLRSSLIKSHVARAKSVLNRAKASNIEMDRSEMITNDEDWNKYSGENQPDIPTKAAPTNDSVNLSAYKDIMPNLKEEVSGANSISQVNAKLTQLGKPKLSQKQYQYLKRNK